MKVLSVAEVPPFHSEHNPYIPFSISWDTPGRATPFYYSPRDGDRLIEIGVDPITLAVCKLVVVNIVRLDDFAVDFAEADSEAGLPILERDVTWSEGEWYSIVEGNFRISYRDPWLNIYFSPDNSKPAQVLVAGPVKFALDSKRNLAGIQVELPGAGSTLL